MCPISDVFGDPVNPKVTCVNVKWPKCIEAGVNYESENSKKLFSLSSKPLF